MSAVLFVAGQSAIGRFLQIAKPAEGYCAAGSVLARMMRVYLSAMFPFFGAEIVAYRALEGRQGDARAPSVAGYGATFERAGAGTSSRRSAARR